MESLVTQNVMHASLCHMPIGGGGGGGRVGNRWVELGGTGGGEGGGGTGEDGGS